MPEPRDPMMSGPELQPASQLALAVLLVMAMWHDALSRRIPNALVLWGLMTALLLSLTPGGLGLGHAALGGMVGFLVFWLLYLLKVVGAGDVKLVMVVSMFIGFPSVLWLCLIIFMAGGLLALIWALWTGQWLQVFRNLRTGIGLLWTLGPSSMNSPVSIFPVSQTRLPYALAIGLGTGAHLLNPWAMP